MNTKAWLPVILLGLTACGGGDDDAGGEAAAPDAAPAQADGAPSPGSPDAMPSGPDATPGATATLAGNVTRSAEPQNGAVGHLYLAVFRDNPITNMDQTPVAQALLEDVDMSADGATTPYSVPGVPLRAEAYHVVAFLDDNGTVGASDPADAGPDMGDLISMTGLAVPTVVVNETGTVPLDLDLNLAFPF